MRAEVLPTSSKIFAVTKLLPESPAERIIWTSQMDEYLAKLAETYKRRNWKAVAREMQKQFTNPRIEAKKCRERWACCANPDISKQSLTDAEELMLVICHNLYQNMWTKMARMIPRRYSSTLKNNFYSLVRSVLRRVLLNELKKPSGLYLLQVVYVSSIVAQLLARPSNYPHKRGAIPSHIHSLIVEKGVTSTMCEEYLNVLIRLLIKQNTDRRELARLEKFTKLGELYGLFLAILQPLRTKFAPYMSDASFMHDSASVEVAILDELEKALIAGASLPAPHPAPGPGIPDPRPRSMAQDTETGKERTNVRPAGPPTRPPSVSAAPAMRPRVAPAIPICYLPPQTVMFHPLQVSIASVSLPYSYVVNQTVIQAGNVPTGMAQARAIPWCGQQMVQGSGKFFFGR